MTSVCYNRENGKEDFLYEKMNFLAADRFSAVRLRSDAGRRIHHQQSGTDPDGIAGIRAYWQNELNEVKKRYPEAVEPDYIEDIRNKIARLYGWSLEEADFMLLQGVSSNHAYHPKKPAINILYKDGTLKDISEASDQLNISVLSQPVVKHFICYPKELEL